MKFLAKLESIWLVCQQLCFQRYSTKFYSIYSAC